MDTYTKVIIINFVILCVFIFVVRTVKYRPSSAKKREKFCVRVGNWVIITMITLVIAIIRFILSL